MTIPPPLQPYHIDTTPTPDGYLLARFRYFASPTPQTVIVQFARLGCVVRCISYNSDQSVCEIKYEVAA